MADVNLANGLISWTFAGAPVTNGDAPAKNQSGWRARLTEREVAEVTFDVIYARHFAHGTAGHTERMLIAKLAAILDEIQPPAVPGEEGDEHGR